MKVNCYLSLLTGLLLFGCASANETNQTVYPQTDGAGSFELNELEYFQNRGVGVMPFLDTAPESHQGGVIMVMHGTRIATNGDLRLEATPGQWSPVPVQQERIVDYENQEVRATMTYPDPNQNMQGFNPIYYPDLDLKYDVIVSADGDDINIRVDLDWPIPEEFVGEVGFTMEFYPHDLFGKSWHMDEQAGIFPMQAYGVTAGYDSTPTPEILPSGDLKSYLPLPNHQAKPVPLATGRTLTIAPESEKFRTQISTRHGELELLDGRVQHQNGWFIVRSTVEAGATDGAIEWTISPNVIPDWVAEPVLQYSQVGYHPGQDKVAVIETDPNDQFDSEIQLVRLKANGQHEVIRSEHPEAWGDFLRYQYYQFDFSDVTADGMYQLVLDDQKSEVFRISNDVYAQNVWQPTLDYFLPVQMCHMRVKEKYKLWHDVCHLDDALMAPKDINHFDGYVQGASTLTDYKPMDHVPGLNQGGWHDAGDDDLRIESQSGEVFILSAAYDEFHVIRDNSLIDWNQNLVEIREPDGDPDILQQIEHGLRNIVGGYESMGRLYRGVIVPTLTQYVMGGDFSGQSDNLIYDPELDDQEKTGTHSNVKDDRWVFTEENPSREFDAIANIASSVTPMRGYNDEMAAKALNVAEELWNVEREETGRTRYNKLRAAVELYRATEGDEYRSYILDNQDFIIENFRGIGWSVARVVHDIDDQQLTAAMRNAARDFYADIEESMSDTPYGLSFDMQLWGRGWTLQSQGVNQYFLHKAFPNEFGKEYLLNVIHYVLGSQPGSNNQSYVSGVGARSKTAAYGMTRMDNSYIPGGAIVGTALIEPDFPELKEFSYLWQQSEYVMGGGSSNFMFLVLAADKLLNEE